MRIRPEDNDRAVELFGIPNPALAVLAAIVACWRTTRDPVARSAVTAAVGQYMDVNVEGTYRYLERRGFVVSPGRCRSGEKAYQPTSMGIRRLKDVGVALVREASA